MSSDAWSFKINPDGNLRLFYTLPTGTVIRFTELGPPCGSNEYLYAPDLTCVKVWGHVWNDPEQASEPIPLMNRHHVTGYICLEMNSPMGFYNGKFVEQ